MPFQSGWIVVALLLGLVYVPPARARSVAAAGLPDVPLFVQPDSWSLVNFSVVLSGRVIVLDASSRSHSDGDGVRRRISDLGQLAARGVGIAPGARVGQRDTVRFATAMRERRDAAGRVLDGLEVAAAVREGGDVEQLSVIVETWFDPL